MTILGVKICHMPNLVRHTHTLTDRFSFIYLLYNIVIYTTK